MEPKIVAKTKNGTLYWCPAREQQMFETLCKQKYFKKTSGECRACLGKAKGNHWPEPWASLNGKKEE